RGCKALLTMYKGLMRGTDACSTGGALLAQKAVAFRTVVTFALRVQIPATAPPWLRGHDRHHRPSRLVTTRHNCAMRCSEPVRCAAFGQDPICGQAWSMGFPGWSDAMACLHRSQTGTGAIKASVAEGTGR